MSSVETTRPPCSAWKKTYWPASRATSASKKERGKKYQPVAPRRFMVCSYTSTNASRRAPVRSTSMVTPFRSAALTFARTERSYSIQIAERSGPSARTTFGPRGSGRDGRRGSWASKSGSRAKVDTTPAARHHASCALQKASSSRGPSPNANGPP